MRELVESRAAKAKKTLLRLPPSTHEVSAGELVDSKGMLLFSREIRRRVGLLSPLYPRGIRMSSGLTSCRVAAAPLRPLRVQPFRYAGRFAVGFQLSSFVFRTATISLHSATAAGGVVCQNIFNR